MFNCFAHLVTPCMRKKNTAYLHSPASDRLFIFTHSVFQWMWATTAMMIPMMSHQRARVVQSLERRHVARSIHFLSYIFRLHSCTTRRGCLHRSPRALTHGPPLRSYCRKLFPFSVKNQAPRNRKHHSCIIKTVTQKRSGLLAMSSTNCHASLLAFRSSKPLNAPPVTRCC